MATIYKTKKSFNRESQDLSQLFKMQMSENLFLSHIYTIREITIPNVKNILINFVVFEM